MPFFGVDDVLFLLASSTALLWAKRADVLESSVYTTVHLLTNDPEQAAERAAAAARAARESSPTLLLRGFDLDAEAGALPRREDCRSRGTSACNNDLPSLADFATSDMGTLTSSDMLVKESVHTQLRESPLVYQVPQVPHRHYNQRKRRLHVSTLATASEEEVKNRISRHTVPEVQTLFAKMEREGLWEAVIHVSYGIEQAAQQLRYLNQHNVECAIRTLLNTAHPDVALVYYFRFGEDMLVADDILVALFHTCRNDAQLSLELCNVLQPFRSRWSPTVYACCLTTTAHFDYAQAIELYDTYMETQRSAQLAAQRTLRRVLAATPLLRETGVVSDAPPLQLHYLYHVIIPLVVAHDPASAPRYVADMLESDAAAAPEVLLRCLEHRTGREVAWRYLEQLTCEGAAAAVPAQVTEWVRTHDKTRGALAGGGQGAPDDDVAGLALSLYRLRPSAMNMNTLLKLCTESNQVAQDFAASSRACSPIHNATITRSPSCLHRAAPLQLAAPSRNRDKLAVLARGEAAELTALLHHVPLHSELDATVLARTITEQHATWGLALQFLTVMLRRKCFNVVPGIAAHLARHGQWQMAVRSMAVYLSNQRAAMTTEEAKLCIEASVHAGQWASALFWVERAHAKGLALAPSTYDLVLGVSRHCTFETAERVMTRMHDVGASCSEQGILDFVTAAAHQGRVSNAFRVLQHHSNVEWTS